MRNEAAVVIRKGMTAAGVGLLEAALVREGGNGCSVVLCSVPVAIEPSYERFDTSAIVGPRPGEAAVISLEAPSRVTLDVYAAVFCLLEDDKLIADLRIKSREMLDTTRRQASQRPTSEVELLIDVTTRVAYRNRGNDYLA